MTAIEFLNQILAIFEFFRDNNKILEKLLENEMLCSTFELRYILNNVDFQFKIINTIYVAGNAVEFYLEALDGSLYKAEVFFDGKWLLKSYLLECQGCFGDDDKCNVCGGSGWGVL